jgi:hypothetical protein
VLGASIIIVQMMEAANTSETSVNFYQTTRRNIPEDGHLHTRRRENLKFHLKLVCFLGCLEMVYQLYGLSRNVG